MVDLPVNGLLLGVGGGTGQVAFALALAQDVDARIFFGQVDQIEIGGKGGGYCADFFRVQGGDGFSQPGVGARISVAAGFALGANFILPQAHFGTPERSEVVSGLKNLSMVLAE